MFNKSNSIQSIIVLLLRRTPRSRSRSLRIKERLTFPGTEEREGFASLFLPSSLTIPGMPLGKGHRRWTRKPCMPLLTDLISCRLILGTGTVSCFVQEPLVANFLLSSTHSHTSKRINRLSLTSRQGRIGQSISSELNCDPISVGHKQNCLHTHHDG